MNDVPPLHQVRSPEGREGWQWMSGLIFYYDKDDSFDNDAAKLLALECSVVTTKIQYLQEASKLRAERVNKTEPVILNFEEARAEWLSN